MKILTDDEIREIARQSCDCWARDIESAVFGSTCAGGNQEAA